MLKLFTATRCNVHACQSLQIWPFIFTDWLEVPAMSRQHRPDALRSWVRQPTCSSRRMVRDNSLPSRHFRAS